MSNHWITPEDYFQHIVDPTVVDYRRERADHLKEAAIFQLSSFSERFFKYHSCAGNYAPIFGKPTHEEFNKAMRRLCPEHKLLWDAANGVKHQIPDGITHVRTLVATSSEVWSPDDQYDVGGRSVTLDQAIETVYAFWRTILFGADA